MKETKRAQLGNLHNIIRQPKYLGQIGDHALVVFVQVVVAFRLYGVSTIRMKCQVGA